MSDSSPQTSEVAQPPVSAISVLSYFCTAAMFGAGIGLLAACVGSVSAFIAIPLYIGSGYLIGHLCGKLAVNLRISRPFVKSGAAAVSVSVGIWCFSWLMQTGAVANVASPDVAIERAVFAVFELALKLGVGFVALTAAVFAASRRHTRLSPPSTELPLLRRELTELANRRRTYIIRIIGAAVILLLVIDRYHVTMSSRMLQRGTFGISGPTQFLGIGEDIFAAVVPQLFTVISLLLPALCCASVTSEKESNTIGTLLLTRLSPGTIVIEKFGSRLVPMLTLLLLTFPVLAHVYALGGVDTDLLIGTIWLLLCQCFLVAAMAIACSAWFGSTVSAFICSYALVGLFAAATYSLGWSSFVPSAIWEEQFLAGKLVSGGMVVLQGNVSVHQSWSGIMVATIPSLVFTGLFLLAASLFLVRRAFVSQSSIILKMFRALDRFFKELNERTTGGIELVTDVDDPPGDDPIAWRERSKKSLGKARYLIRVLLALEFPVLFICMLAATASSRSAFQGLYVLQGIVWTLCTLIVAVRAATLMSSERSRQTLEALLSAPLTAREILDQKIAGIRRLLIVMSVPILTVNLTHFLIHVDTSSVSGFVSGLPRPAVYMLLSTAGTFVFLYLITWISAGLGTKIHSQTRAVIAAAVVLLLWVSTPMFAARLFSGGNYRYATVYEALVSFSPYGTVRANEIFLIENYINGNLSSYRSIVTGEVPRFLLSAVSTLVQVLVLLAVRGFVRWQAPNLLQRRDTSAAPIENQFSREVSALEGVSA